MLHASPVIAAAAAIANALADTTGHRFTGLPISSEAIAQAGAHILLVENPRRAFAFA
ncbi:MAG: hypothetical protein ACE5JD_05525 [Candidatus Methylomirabilia bacterium]